MLFQKEHDAPFYHIIYAHTMFPCIIFNTLQYTIVYRERIHNYYGLWFITQI